ncbi:MAG: NYN domain-containing protein [Syntrophothermaceae bacterium]|jgi:predicted RNA-binding protein with PIN domain
METVLIVDGYNVINSWPELVELKQQTLEDARGKLLEIMTNYAALTGIKVVIVYDAYQVKGARGSKEFYHGVEVIFSREGETADEVIERAVGEYMVQGSHQVYVATSDWTEQRIIFGKGGLRIPARDLYLEVEKKLMDMKEYEKNQEIADRFLEHRLSDSVRGKLENWRRK